MQKSVSSVIDSRQARTRRLNQSTMAMRYLFHIGPQLRDRDWAYERASELFDIDRTIIDLEGMAEATHRIFFEKAARASA